MAIRLAGKRGPVGPAGPSPLVIATAGASAATINSLIAGVAGTIGARTGGGRVILPAGTYSVDTPILLKQHVVLEGEGPGTILVNDGLAAGEAVIQNSADGDRRFGLRNLAIDATDADYGLHLDTPDTPGGQEYSDGIYTISDVEIFDADLDGVYLEGRGQAIVRNMRVRDSGRHGYVIDAVDSIYDGLEAGGVGSAGIVVRGSNNRLSNCKTFWSGAITAADGHGIWFDGSLGGQHSVLSNCETQDNNAHGVFFDGYHDVRVESHISEGNNAGNYSAANQGGCGYYIDAASDIKIEGSAFGRVSNTQDQRYAIGMANGAENLKAVIYSANNQTGHIQNGWHWATDIRINNYDGNQAISYSASRTPDPTLGRKMLVGPLTGNITINNVAAANYAIGHELIIMVLQDGSGGRTVTWGSEYATGGFTPTTTANYLNIYQFVRDDAAWVLVSGRAMDYTAFV